MHKTDAELFEHALAHFFRHLRRVSDLSEIFRGLNQRIDDKGLTPPAQFFDDQLINRPTALLVIDFSLNRQASRRHFI